MTRYEILKESLEMARYKVSICSEDEQKPKPGFERKWMEESEKVKILRQMLSELAYVKVNATSESSLSCQLFVGTIISCTKDFYVEVKISNSYNPFSKKYEYRIFKVLPEVFHQWLADSDTLDNEKDLKFYLVDNVVQKIELLEEFYPVLCKLSK